MRTRWIAVAAVMLAGAVCGCAERNHVRKEPAHEKFWQSCEETVPAIADGFQHFRCSDVKGKQWEVLVRKEPKK